MKGTGPYHVRTAALALLVSAIAVTAQSANAAAQLLVGVDRVKFAWSPPSGATTGYWVSRSLNGAAFQTYAYSTSPTIEIPVAVGDELMVAVAAVATNSSGALIVGPQSPVSDRVIVQAAPRFSKAVGTWVMRCPTCPGLMRRAISDASVISGQAAGPSSTWRVLGRGKLNGGRYQLVFQNGTTGQLALWDERALVPLAGAVGTASIAMRGVGSADFDGDGVEEFVMQRTDTNVASLWSVTASGFVSVGTLPGPAGALLAAARDLDRDGKIDLLWRDPSLGTLDLWSLKGDPRIAMPLSSLIKLPVTRVVSGLVANENVAATGDYDGDGWVDLLWQASDGGLGISYLVRGAQRSYADLPYVTTDVNQLVAGSAEVDGTAGEEIALQHRTTAAITVLDPVTKVRTVVVNPGSGWKVIAVGS